MSIESRQGRQGRQGLVFYKDIFAGIIEETFDGNYRFRYDVAYLENPEAQSISLS